MRLEVRVLAAMVSTRAPEYPAEANSTVATSMMSRRVRSGSFLRSSLRFFGFGVMSVRCSMLPLQWRLRISGAASTASSRLPGTNQFVHYRKAVGKQAAHPTFLRKGGRAAGGKNNHKNKTIKKIEDQKINIGGNMNFGTPDKDRLQH